MTRSSSSWLSGPVGPDNDDAYRGQSLGLPEDGSGALAGMGRRLLALIVDWLIGYGLAALAMTAGLIGQPQLSLAVLVAWLLVGAVSVRLYGFSPGQLAVGLRVASVDGRKHVGIGRALSRGALIALVFPALFTDLDGRGFQDRLTATAVVRR
ncbi:RDD family protein [Mycobacterium sp. 1274756.6]|uniref:RDD family protein n=1 Tax=Mycobacterium sp. 1274756.6 TaxID=1834076 RepID=UPI0007FBB565|nr:RDD family protein [Mycobacterium sp. 1274756.6]OBJ73374.1 transporter [Mycobacterium sp. 1274756.6]